MREELLVSRLPRYPVPELAALSHCRVGPDVRLVREHQTMLVRLDMRFEHDVERHETLLDGVAANVRNGGANANPSDAASAEWQRDGGRDHRRRAHRLRAADAEKSSRVGGGRGRYIRQFAIGQVATREREFSSCDAWARTYSYGMGAIFGNSSCEREFFC